MNKNVDLSSTLENNTEDFCSVLNYECPYWGRVFDDEISCPTSCECKADWDLLNTWAQRAKDLGVYDEFIKELELED